MNSPIRDNGPVDRTADLPATDGGPDAVENKRIAARRRFLKMGAGGSTAMLVTIAHKRAFAGSTTIKKGAVVSACVSMQGVPDIKGMNQKKALQLSPMGTPKGIMCLPKPATNTCLAPQGTQSKYRDSTGHYFPYFKDGQFKDGCGNLADTVAASYNYRLYEQGYCPVIFDSNGDLTYDDNKIYYEKKDCKPSDVDPVKGIVACLENVVDPYDPSKTFDLLGRVCGPRL